MKIIPKIVDVIVIGAGTIGTATAWHLAKKGQKVLLLDRNQIGSGNTSKAASLMTKVRTKEELIPLIQETYNNIDEIEQITNQKVGKKEVGTLHFSASEETKINLDKTVALANKYHIKNRYIDKKELMNLVPWLDTQTMLEASFMEDDSFVDAYVLAKVFADAAIKEGVIINQNTDVESILFNNNQVYGVKTTKGEVHAPNVVDAAGAWSNDLSLKENIPIPMAAVRSIYWITESNKDLFPEHHPMLVIPDANVYSRPENGSLLFGLREENSPHFHPKHLNRFPNSDFLGNPDDRWGLIEKYGRKFQEFFPDFFDMGIKNVITGISTYTPDGYYTLGSFPGKKGFYAATGCAGAGVAGSGGIGRLIAEMITEESLFVNPEPFRIDRFGTFDPMSSDFRQRCSDARSNKKDGG